MRVEGIGVWVLGEPCAAQDSRQPCNVNQCTVVIILQYDRNIANIGLVGLRSEAWSFILRCLLLVKEGKVPTATQWSAKEGMLMASCKSMVKVIQVWCKVYEIDPLNELIFFSLKHFLRLEELYLVIRLDNFSLFHRDVWFFFLACTKDFF